MDAALCRTIACFLVVLVHVNIQVRGPVGAWWPLGAYGAPLYAATVPAFLLLSGYAAEGGLALGRRLRRLWPPFVFWNGVVLATWAVQADELPTVGAAAWTLLTGAWHLYFLCVLFQLFALHAAWRRYVPSLGLRTVLIGATLLALGSHGLSELLLWVHGADDGLFEAEGRKLFTFWAPYYLLGVALRRGAIDLPALSRRVAPLAVIGFPLYVLELRAQDARFGYLDRMQLLTGMLPFQLGGGVWLVHATEWLERRFRSARPVVALRSLAPDTLAVYLAHGAVILWLYPALQAMGWTSAERVEAPFVALAVFALCLLGVRVARFILPLRIRALCLGDRPR
jgi:surface polysaccharide O-acyltransferase-like enzyme